MHFIKILQMNELTNEGTNNATYRARCPSNITTRSVHSQSTVMEHRSEY